MKLLFRWKAFEIAQGFIQPQVLHGRNGCQKI